MLNYQKVLIILLTVLSYTNLFKRTFDLKSAVYALEQLNPFQSDLQQKTCRLPRLELKGHLNVEKYLKCKVKDDWGYLKDHKWRLNKTVVSKLGCEVKCRYRSVTRLGDDFKLSRSDYAPLQDGQSVSSEVIEVSCNCNSSNEQRFEVVLAQIIDKSNDFKWEEKRDNSKCRPLNILLLSYDSMSRVSWFKRLPQTTALLLDEMNFDLLYGFNIVGDGTPACMIPLLTGATEAELPSTLKSDPKGKFVDQVYPFIWNDLHEKGYISFHMEDWPQVSAFTYRLRGMSNRTAHHYMRAYQLATWQRVSGAYFGGRDDLCMGAQKRHKRALNLIDEFMRTYAGRSRPFVAISHYIENSHDGNARANHMDVELKDFLERILNDKNKTVLESTALFVYSDHGARFAAERLSEQGELEERLPFFALRLPDWFKRDNPKKYANFLKNAQQLTTPFDIYATLRDLSCLGDNERTNQIRSRSLLRPIPTERSCEDVGLSLHYCSCELNWRNADLSLKVSLVAFKFVIDYINNDLLSKAKNFCTPLKLYETLEVKYAYVNVNGGNETYFRLAFTTNPNGGSYVALLKFDSTAGFSIESPASISRTNSYGMQARCLESFHSSTPELMVDLRKFCLCPRFMKFKPNHRRFPI